MVSKIVVTSRSCQYFGQRIKVATRSEVPLRTNFVKLLSHNTVSSYPFSRRIHTADIILSICSACCSCSASVTKGKYYNCLKMVCHGHTSRSFVVVCNCLRRSYNWSFFACTRTQLSFNPKGLLCIATSTHVLIHSACRKVSLDKIFSWLVKRLLVFS